MNSMRITTIALFLASTALPMAIGAPDTPPAVTWDVTIPEPTNPDCTASSTSATHVLGITADSSGNAYTLESCPRSGATRGLIIRRFEAATGSISWQYRIGCGALACQGWGIAADSSGHLGIAYEDPTQATASKTIFLFFEQSTGLLKCTRNGSNAFTLDLGTPLTVARSVVAFNHPDGSQRVIYAIAGAVNSESILVSAESTCVSLWHSPGQGGRFGVTYAPTTRMLYMLSDPGAVQNIARVNATTGASITSINPGATYATAFWTNSTALRLWATTSGSTMNLTEYNATSLAVTRALFTPTEARIFYSGLPRPTFITSTQRTYLDGANSWFACGYMDDGTGYIQAVSKFNMTAAAGMRWNVTFTAPPTGYVSRWTDCLIAPGGALYVSSSIETADGQSQSYLRKYDGAGTPRPTGPTINLPSSTSTGGPTFTPADFGSGIANFGISIGFTSAPSLFFWGLILLVIVVVIVGATIKGVTKSDRTTGISCGISALAMMIFNVNQQLWPLDATVLIIILSSAVILYFTRNLFIRSGAG